MEKTCYERFLDDLALRGCSARTIEAYTYDLTQFFRFCGLPFTSLSEHDLLSITGAHVQNFLNSAMRGGARFSTLRRNLAALRRFFTSVLDRRESPARDVRLSSLAQEPLCEAKLIELFARVSKRERVGGETTRLRDQLILFFMFFLDVRPYRVPKLSVSEIERWEYGIALRITRKRTVPIEGLILEKLHAFLKLRGPGVKALFNAAGRERPIALSAVLDLLKSSSRLIDVELTPMLIRETSHWLQNFPERAGEILQKIAAARE